MTGRYGDEEFVVVMSNCRFQYAKVVAERIRLSIADVPIATPVGPLAVTVSIGLAAYGLVQADEQYIIGAADAGKMKEAHETEFSVNNDAFVSVVFLPSSRLQANNLVPTGLKSVEYSVRFCPR